MAAVTLRRSAWGLDTDGPNWRVYSACAGLAELFDAEAVGGGALVQAAQAIHICLRHCPVLTQCTAETDKHPPRHGVAAARLWKSSPTGPGPTRHQPSATRCGAHCAHLEGS